jgi:hypothetical protein
MLRVSNEFESKTKHLPIAASGTATISLNFTELGLVSGEVYAELGQSSDCSGPQNRGRLPRSERIGLVFHLGDQL